jgi:hypothetical protein
MSATFWFDWRPANVYAEEGKDFGTPERGIRGLAGEIGPRTDKTKPRSHLRDFYDEAMQNCKDLLIDNSQCLFMGGTTSELQHALGKAKDKGTESFMAVKEPLDLRYVRREAGRLKEVGAAHSETVLALAAESYWRGKPAEFDDEAVQKKTWAKFFLVRADNWDAGLGDCAVLQLSSLIGMIPRAKGVNPWF